MKGCGHNWHKWKLFNYTLWLNLAVCDMQISDEQIIHSHSPLLMLPSLRSKHCVIVGQGPGVSVVRQEYP